MCKKDLTARAADKEKMTRFYVTAKVMQKPEPAVRPTVGPSSTWTRPSATGSAPSARCAHATTSAGGKMVIFGGWNGGRMLNDLHLFLPDTMTWSRPITTGEAPGPRAGHTITAVGNRVLVFGGGDGSHYLNDLHVLDLGGFYNSIESFSRLAQKHRRGPKRMLRARVLRHALDTAPRSSALVCSSRTFRITLLSLT